MKIVITCDELPIPPLNGNNRKTHDLLLGIHMNHKIVCVGYAESEQEAQKTINYWNRYGIEWRFLNRNVRYKRCRAIKEWLTIPTVTRRPDQEYKIIDEAISNGQPIKLIIDNISGGQVLRFFKRKDGIILSGHDCMSRLFREEGLEASGLAKKIHYWFRHQFARNAERIFCHNAERVHLVSQTDADELKLINKNASISVIPIGGERPEPSCLRPFIQRDRFLLWGNLRSPVILKGVRELFARTDRKSLNFLKSLTILGRVEKAEAEALVPGIVQVGCEYISRADNISNLLGETKVLYLPDLSGTGQKNRTIDGLSHGCVVVGLPEVFRDIPHSQEGVSYLSVQNFSEMSQLLENISPIELENIAKRGRIVFESELEVSILGKRWLRLIESVGCLNGT